MATYAYTTGLNEIMDGTIDWEDATDIKLMLLVSGYTFNPDHTFVDMSGADDPIDHELNVSGYDPGFSGTGRITLTGKTITANTTDDRVTFDAADTGLEWTLAAGATVVAAIIYRHNTSDAASRLLFYVDFTDTATNGGTFTLTFNAGGILYVNTALP